MDEHPASNHHSSNEENKKHKQQESIPSKTIRMSQSNRTQPANELITDPKSPNDIHQIGYHLFLTNFIGACNYEGLKSRNITHILVCAREVRPRFPEDFIYRQIELDDLEKETINHLFYPCFKWIEEAIKSNPNHHVLIHCQMGISRSATIAIGYLMYKFKKPYSEVFQFVRTQRNCVSPNYGFVKQLKQMERSNYILVPPSCSTQTDSLSPSQNSLPLQPSDTASSVSLPPSKPQTLQSSPLSSPLSPPQPQAHELPLASPSPLPSQSLSARSHSLQVPPSGNGTLEMDSRSHSQSQSVSLVESQTRSTSPSQSVSSAQVEYEESLSQSQSHSYSVSQSPNPMQ